MSWWTIAAIGGATYLLRASFLVFFAGRSTPRLEHYLQFVPVAVLPALAVSAVIGHGTSELDVRIVAALTGAAIAWRTRSVTATMATGMVVLWLLQAWRA